MSVVASALFAASAAIVLVLGSLHALYTFRGQKLWPRDSALVQRMQEVSPVITRQTTIWRSGLGFHASHSSGAILFGALYLFLAFEPSRLLFGSVFLLCLGLTYVVVMVVLARLYWFSVPFRGLALAAALYAVGIVAVVANPLWSAACRTLIWPLSEHHQSKSRAHPRSRGRAGGPASSRARITVAYEK